MLIEDFTNGTAANWRYVSDRVMGGLSDGGFQILEQNGTHFARLSGTVSTANNGGFIQIRRDLPAALPATSQGLSLRLRGNGERYFVHLRPISSRRPWQYFAAPIDTDGHWQSAHLSWSNFTPQGGLQAHFNPTDITSIGLVAYGADYNATLDIARIHTL